MRPLSPSFFLAGLGGLLALVGCTNPGSSASAGGDTPGGSDCCVIPEPTVLTNETDQAHTIFVRDLPTPVNATPDATGSVAVASLPSVARAIVLAPKARTEVTSFLWVAIDDETAPGVLLEANGLFGKHRLVDDGGRLSIVATRSNDRVIPVRVASACTTEERRAPSSLTGGQWTEPVALTTVGTSDDGCVSLGFARPEASARICAPAEAIPFRPGDALFASGNGDRSFTLRRASDGASITWERAPVLAPLGLAQAGGTSFLVTPDATSCALETAACGPGAQLRGRITHGGVEVDVTGRRPVALEAAERREVRVLGAGVSNLRAGTCAVDAPTAGFVDVLTTRR